MIFSSSGVMNANTFLCEELASHGYVVVCLGHPYWCEFYFDNEGGIIPFNKDNDHYRKMWKEEDSQIVNDIKDRITRAVTPEVKLDLHRQLNQNMPVEVGDLRLWAEDIGFVIDVLDEMNQGEGLFGRLLDMDRIGVTGYSKGGAAAGQACVTDKRCKDGINLGGFMFGDIVEKKLTTPFMFMEHVEPWCQECLPINDGFFHQAQGDVYMVRIKDATHGNFTDLSAAKDFIKFENVMGPIDGAKFLEIMNRYVLGFFDRYLKDLPAPILDGPSPAYGGPIFKSRIK